MKDVIESMVIKLKRQVKIELLILENYKKKTHENI